MTSLLKKMEGKVKSSNKRPKSPSKKESTGMTKKKSVLQQVREREGLSKKEFESVYTSTKVEYSRSGTFIAKHFGIVVFLMIVVMIYSAYKYEEWKMRQPSTTNEANEATNHNPEVWAFTQMYVKGQLKSPKSVDFPFAGVRHITPLGNNRFKVDSYVDAQNTFGANVRTHFECIVRINPYDMEQFSFK